MFIEYIDIELRYNYFNELTVNIVLVHCRFKEIIVKDWKSCLEISS
jgi:hypothetical protein